MAVITFGPHEVGKKYHVEYPTLKHVENSIRGSKHAKRIGCKTTDLDMLPDGVLTTMVERGQPLTPGEIAGHLRNTHWPDPFRRDGFRDPKHILGRGNLITHMTPVQIDRIVAGRWPRQYHIPHIEAQLAFCATIHLQVLLEPKQSPVWLRQEVWDYLASVAERNHTRTAVYSLMHECLPYAKRAGFNAWPIAH